MYETHEAVDDAFDKYSVDSLEYPNREPPLKSLADLDKKPFQSSEPFWLHTKGHDDPNSRLLEFYSPQEELGTTKPMTESCATGKDFWKCEIDESILISKGLQLNQDGSFSRSPRNECEDLPFVMPGPVVAQIRQRRWQSIRRTGQREVTGRINEINSKGRKSLQNIPDGGRACRTLTGVSRSAHYVPKDVISQLKTADNLTDSMKEALFQTYKEQQQQLGTPRDFISTSKGSENFLPNLKKSDPKVKKSSCQKLVAIAGGKERSEESERAVRSPGLNNSDLHLPSIRRTRLSYYERYQKEKGFDPRGISLSEHKVLKDTVRSNFGDSARETLSDVSTGCDPVEDDESEESFYRSIMAGEKAYDTGSRWSCRSSEGGRRKASKSVERRKEVSAGRGSNPRRRGRSSCVINLENSTGVELRNSAKHSLTLCTPSSVGDSTGRSRKKCHHLCPANPEPLQRAELVSRARAYGNLASTRNIVKLQMKSQKGVGREDAFPGHGAVNKADKSGEPVTELPAETVQTSSSVLFPSFRKMMPEKRGSSLPSVEVKDKEAEIPWETRNLLMQIAAERDLFKESMEQLRNQINAKRKLCVPSSHKELHFRQKTFKS